MNMHRPWFKSNPEAFQREGEGELRRVVKRPGDSDLHRIRERAISEAWAGAGTVRPHIRRQGQFDEWRPHGPSEEITEGPRGRVEGVPVSRDAQDLRPLDATFHGQSSRSTAHSASSITPLLPRFLRSSLANAEVGGGVSSSTRGGHKARNAAMISMGGPERRGPGGPWCLGFSGMTSERTHAAQPRNERREVVVGHIHPIHNPDLEVAHECGAVRACFAGAAGPFSSPFWKNTPEPSPKKEIRPDGRGELAALLHVCAHGSKNAPHGSYSTVFFTGEELDLDLAGLPERKDACYVEIDQSEGMVLTWSNRQRTVKYGGTGEMQGKVGFQRQKLAFGRQGFLCAKLAMIFEHPLPHSHPFPD
ncbi:hypothetical protein BDK51DRAFT_41791 [Blyttiomyces helicus]|uniref:Uncharacterized protein n=1 Tax=Blyttiomyces helicus TaxID=388810 RepID=A0A4P9WA71_9FUNG|nr:hypothetical protein BDK51DRAFT_41791 [Blyttiomyces helicus]|eukprot:RKO87740.1 hypothetical protein BDK51DRAFT_41791 [Blyttiomyces helicus]